MIWLVPLTITFLVFGFTVWRISTSKPVGDYGMIGQALALFIMLLFSTIISLIAWLVWALIA